MSPVASCLLVHFLSCLSLSSIQLGEKHSFFFFVCLFINCSVFFTIADVCGSLQSAACQIWMTRIGSPSLDSWRMKQLSDYTSRVLFGFFLSKCIIAASFFFFFNSDLLFFNTILQSGYNNPLGQTFDFSGRCFLLSCCLQFKYGMT